MEAWFNPLGVGQVMAQNADLYTITVLLDSGQTLPLVRPIIQNADGARGKIPPLPGRGQRGLIVFPNGDTNNPLWLGSLIFNAYDVVNGESPFEETNHYFSDVYTHLDEKGNYLFSHPSDTWFSIAPTLTKPTLHKHVHEDGKRVKVAFPDSDLTTQPVPNLYLHHGSGTTIQLDTTGDIIIKGATASPKAHVSFTFGGTTMTIDSSGNVLVTLGGSAKFGVETSAGGYSSDSLSLTSAVTKQLNKLWTDVNNNSLITMANVPGVPVLASEVESTICLTEK